MERTGIIMMLPFIIEFFIKLRSRFKASSLGKLRDDGKLDPPYGRKIYSWTHFLMNLRPMTERQIVMVLIFLEFCFAAVAFLYII
jgi:UDP-N-acetylglucosamine--dolichyl-phosphate N-acetylglucosaminephosphotransferase